MDEPQVNEELVRMQESLRVAMERSQAYVPRIREARRRFRESNSSPEALEALTQVEAEAFSAQQEAHAQLQQLQDALGIPEETLDAYDDVLIGGDQVDRNPRASVTADKVTTTDDGNVIFPDALKKLRDQVHPNWLKTEQDKPYRLGAEFMSEPLSLIGGVRVASERRPIHRYAQMVSVLEDYLNGHPGFDWFAGSLLLPQAGALGLALEALPGIAGNTLQRLRRLWKGPSEETDSTVYEFLVAAACARKGRAVEMIEEGAGRTPDLRIHDFNVPVVVECKRRPLLVDAEVKEDEIARALFARLRAECRSIGMYGRFDLLLDCRPEDVPTEDVVAALRQQRLFPSPDRPTKHPWGAVSFTPLPGVMDVRPTHLYCPDFLMQVFRWNTDLTQHDGIVCQVSGPAGIGINKVREPIALCWSNIHEDTLASRTRPAVSLFRKALQQIPPGEMALIYLGYPENGREEVADKRTERLIEELRKTDHEASIRVPAFFVSRIISRCLGLGAPDLVETGAMWLSEVYGDKFWLTQFPATVFTSG